MCIRDRASLEQPGEVADDLVANRVAVGVIDRLEVIDVDHGHRQRPLPRGSVDHAPQVRFAGAVIEQTGHCLLYTSGA